MLLTNHPTIHRTSFMVQCYLVPRGRDSDLQSEAVESVPEFSFSHFLAV